MMPLDWGLRLDLGVALLNAGRPEEARAEFRRTRELEPLNPRVPANEAVLWLTEGRHPAAALAAIEEAFRRRPETGEQTFAAAVHQHGADPELRPGLEALARREPALEVAFMESIPPTEVWPWLDEVLAEDPGLTRHAGNPARLRRFLRQWSHHGDPAEIDATMTRHPAWQLIGWREWAEGLVNGNRALDGCRVLERFARRPDLPPILREVPARSDPDPSGVTADFTRRPEDFALGLRLYRAQVGAGRRGDALETLARLSRLPGAPLYLSYLEARLRMDDGDGAKAWEAWVRYLQGSGQN